MKGTDNIPTLRRFSRILMRHLRKVVHPYQLTFSRLA
jgi:hypothetical protein